MQENLTKSKHILFKFQTIEELIQGTGYKPSLKALSVITPGMTVDSLIQQLMEINEISLACEVMVYALHPRARIWWGCSIIKSLHEEIFAKSEGKEGAKPEGEAEKKAEAPKEKPEAVALPKTKEEAKEMLSQKVGEQKEALGLPQDKKEEKGDDSSNASSSSNSPEKVEQTKEYIEKLKALQEKQRAEQQANFEKAFEMAEKQKQETLKKIEEAIANMSPEEKAFYDQCLTRIDQYFKESIGMTKQEAIDFGENLMKKAEKADESGDPAQKQAVLKEFTSVLSKNSGNIVKMLDEVIKIQEDFEQKQGKNSSGNKAEATKSEENAKAGEKTEIDAAALIKEKEEAQKAEKIKEVEANTAKLENNLRKRAYEAAVAWVNEPTKPNTLNAEKYSKEAGEYPEGMLCLASYWSYGDFTISSDSQNKKEENPEQPETIIRVDPSLPPKGVYSTLLMSALHEGGTRKPVDRFVLYYEMGEKIACGKDNWTSEKVINPNQEHPIAAPEKPKEKPIIKPADKPTYTKWKM